jgi:hypothetical protein
MDAMWSVNNKKLAELIKDATGEVLQSDDLAEVRLDLWLAFKVGSENNLFMLLGSQRKVKAWLVSYLAQKAF